MSQGEVDILNERAKNVLRWLNKEEAPPHHIEIIMTSGCNLHCLPCIARGKTEYLPKAEMSKAKILKIIDEAKELGVKSFHFSGGGEPLFRYDVAIDAIKAVKAKGMFCSIVTNGTLFKDKTIEELVRIKFDQITFSLNGPDEKTDDLIRGIKGSFKKTRKTIELFAFWKKKLGSKYPKVMIAPVVCGYNFDKAADFVELTHKLEVDDLMFQPMSVSPDCTDKSLMLSSKQKKLFMQSLKPAKKLADSYGLNSNLDKIDKEIMEKSADMMQDVIKSESKKFKDDDTLSIPCFSPWFFMSIKANGTVDPCGVEEDSKENLNDKSLKEIWYGKYFNDFRKRLLSKEIPERCKRCCAASVLGLTHTMREEMLKLKNKGMNKKDIQR